MNLAVPSKKQNTFCYYLALCVSLSAPAKLSSALSVQPYQDKQQLSLSLLTCMNPNKLHSIYVDLLHLFITY